MNPKNKILIIGPLPPPAGGISIHIERLTYLLRNDFLFDFIDESVCIKNEYYNIRKLNILRYLRKIYNAELIYIHSGNKLLKKIHILFSKLFRKKIIITFHGFDRHKNKLGKITDRVVFNLVNKIIVVNNEISLKINIPKEKCVVRPAFLPPIMKNEIPLPGYLTDLISHARLTNSIIVCSNASRLNKFKDEDLYGLDMCIELSAKLKKAGISFLFIFNVSSLDEGLEIYKKAHRSIIEKDLGNFFFLINENLSFVRLIKESNIVLRTTNTDGDAISIREAIFLNKSVIASDVVNRPFETILFKTRDIDDLYSKFVSLLQLPVNKSENKIKVNHSFGNDSKIFYKQLIENEL